MDPILDVATISSRAFTDEKEAVRALLPAVEPLASLEPAIAEKAKAWVQDLRKSSIGHGVEAFLTAYGLETEEGVALMCLAEALLRIPDAATADALIESTFEGRHWERYLGEGDSWLVNLSSWGLLLTGKTIDFKEHEQGGVMDRVRTLVGKLGEPVIREALKKAMKLIGSQFVLGETMGLALKESEDYSKKHYRFSYDILGEGARTDAQAKAYVDAYLQGITAMRLNTKKTALLEAPGMSVKLSALHPRYQLAKKDRVMNELLPRLKTILSAAKEAGIAISIDAEESTRLDIELLLFERLLADEKFAGWNGIGFVVQAYQKRAIHVIEWLADLAHSQKRKIPLRLVKGAYWDSEIKWAQVQGLPGYPVFTRKCHTDLSYLACAEKILQHKDCFYPQFATHNARSVASILQMAEKHQFGKDAFEFQRLHGMGEALHDKLLAEGYVSRIYAPVGAHKDLLAYLIRRLLENGANTSFVHLLTDEGKSVDELIADPIAASKAALDKSLPIPLPADIYGTRKNSSGIDFGNLAQLQALQSGIARIKRAGFPPAPRERLGALVECVAGAQRYFQSWSKVPVNERAEMLERAADMFEQQMTELVALLGMEAGRTLQDSVSEVREAADMCRYYAQEARRIFTPQPLASPAGESNQLSLHPRGVFACISPWNFPLAIFTGQIAAALATGNCVVAKPAAQTPRIAQRAVELLYEAGIPEGVLQLAIGSGATIGAQLTSHPHIAGVVFTGSMETARRINQTLAARKGPIIPLIAETGGQNGMAVDSSALLEQAVDDIMLSAFGSAGQRCSSLRVLFVQEDIADGLLALLSGAMQELTLGDPLDPATDIGPVIDANAQASLETHIAVMQGSARQVASTPILPLPGHFVAPHVFELKNISELTQEIFGPVLHVLRFRSGGIAHVPHTINSTGYGLTFGLHSRIGEHAEILTDNVRAGNIYINRSMIGAVVGVQPFGGEGLSGTGFKAGGPHYLLRFVTERVVSVNTAAIGGNTTLLSAT